MRPVAWISIVLSSTVACFCYALTAINDASAYPNIVLTDVTRIEVRLLSSPSASVRDDVWFTGEGLDRITSVEFNGKPAAFRAFKGRFIVTHLPRAATSGPLVIHSGSRRTTLLPYFTVLPAVDHVVPGKGAAGTKITIEGLGLNQVDQVTFGEAPAKFVRLSDSRLIAWVPRLAAEGNVSVRAGRGSTTLPFDLAPPVDCLNPRQLRTLLTCHGVSTRNAPRKNLDHDITSYAVANNDSLFAVGYYRDNRKGYLDGHLFLATLEKDSGLWRERDLYDPVHDVGGSVLSITRTGGFWYVELHDSPSASTTLQVSDDLTIQHRYYGWMKSLFTDGPIVFQNSMVHFAPTHPVRLSLYYPNTGAVVAIFPRKPYGAVQLEHTRRIAALLAQHDQRWPDQHHLSYDPDASERSLLCGPVINDATRSLAFVVAYDEADRQTFHDQFIERAFADTRDALRSNWSWNRVGYDLANDMNAITDSHLKRYALSLFSSEPAILRQLSRDREPFDTTSFVSAQDVVAYEDNSFDIDLYWQSDMVQRKLSTLLRFAPGYVAAVYIYRNVDDPARIEYRELSIPYGASPPDAQTLAQYLTQSELRRAFHP